MSELIRRLSDELAQDPTSLVFIRLAEELRRTGQLDLALKVSLRGLERHPYDAEAHHLLARVCADRGELQRALDEWDTVLRLDPTHLEARKGIGYVRFAQGDLDEAERYLLEAARMTGEDAAIAAALAAVRRQRAATPTMPTMPTQEAAPGVTLTDPESPDSPRPPDAPADAERLFADILGDAEQTALLIDPEGLVMAGAFIDPEGRDVTAPVGAELRGVSDEAQRAMRHLDLGAWTSIAFEAEGATVAMAPAPRAALILVAADPSLPLGFVRRLLDRCAARAHAWLGEGA